MSDQKLIENYGYVPFFGFQYAVLLNILGSYAIIHIFAQDTGLKTSLLQTGILQSHLLFIIASIGMAFSITQNRSQSILALIFYYHLKYVIAQNITE